MEIRKTARGTLPILTVTYGDCAMKQEGILKWRRRFKEEDKTCKMMQEMGSSKQNDRYKISTEYEP